MSQIQTRAQACCWKYEPGIKPPATKPAPPVRAQPPTGPKCHAPMMPTYSGELLIMRQYRRKDSSDSLLVKLMQLSVNDPQLARELVNDHPEVLKLRTRLGETALHYLAIENYAAAVKLLIDLGADVNVTNKFGASARQGAIQARAKDVVEVLQRAGALA